MGLYRYLLAAAVVIGHSAPIPGLPLVGGGLAVKLFFIVSGFYMGLILTEKYQPLPGGLRLFYSNRLLRIFPIFWLVLAIELVVAIAFHRLSDAGDPRLALNASLIDEGQYGALTALVVSQFTLLGTEVVSLLNWQTGSGFDWHAAAPSGAETVRGWRFLLMPHTWTLACELFFYALVPWLNRLPTAALAGIVGGNIVIARLLPGWINPALAEVATDSFAPLQLGFFAAGLLAYRLYARHDARLEKGPVGWLLIAGLAVTVIGFNEITAISHKLGLWSLLLLGTLALPVLFARTRRLRWDRRIGDLSYPLYLVHAVVIMALHRLVPAEVPVLGDFFKHPAFPLGAVALSTLLAWTLETTLDRRLDQLRQRRVAESRSH